MQLHEFQNQMQRLSQVYGERFYTEQRIRLIWNMVREYDERWFERVVDRFILDQRNAPLGPEFREAVNGYERHKQSTRKESEQVNCELCLDGGFVPLRSRNDGKVWAFSCSCSIGIPLRSRAKQFSPELLFQGYMHLGET